MSSRSSLIAGPGLVELVTTPYDAGPPEVPEVAQKWGITSDEVFAINFVREIADQSWFGMPIDHYPTDEYLTIDVPVDNRLTSGRIAALWPYTNPASGAALFGATDKELRVNGRNINDGTVQIFTLKSVAVTKMPSLNFSLTGPLIGSVGFTGLRKDTKAWSDDTSLLSIANSGGTFTDTTLTNASFIHQPYTVTLGTDLVAIDTLGGVQVDFNVGLGKIMTEAKGTEQMFIKSVTAAAKFMPAYQAYDKILGLLKMQGTTHKRGESMAARSAVLTVVGVNTGTTHYTQNNGVIHTGSYRFGLQDNALRDGEIAIVSTRTLTSGATNALFSITAPS